MKHLFTLLFLSVTLLVTNSLFAQLTQSYSLTKRGLDFVQASQKLNKRTTGNVVVGVDQPASFAISGIPAGAVIEKAFLWATTSGNGVAITATIQNPAGITTGAPMTIIGSGEDKCWGYQGSYSYRADVTSLISGNGNYVISGLPTDPANAGGATNNDTDGATLFIIYSNGAASYNGTLIINDGAVVVTTLGERTTTISGINATTTPTDVRAFVAIGDLQYSEGVTLNGTVVTYVPTLWNYLEVSTTLANGQMSATYTYTPIKDCVNWIVAGLYFRTPTPCTAFTATLMPNGQLTCTNKTVTLTAGGGLDGATYQYSAGATNNGASATVTADGPYSVTVTNPGGCSSVATTSVSSNTTAPTASLSNNGPITCANRTVTLTAGGGGTYAFSPGASANGNTATVTNDGLYSVTVTTPANGCTATQTTQVASNTTAPTATLNNNGPITCNQRTVTLTAGGGGTYAFSSGATPSGNTATVTNEGLYSVTVTASNGCTATQSTQVTSNTTVPTATLGNNGPLTANQPTVTLTAGGGGTYSFSSGASQQGGGNTATVNSPGNYQVTVTGTNGCTATASTLVTGATSGSSCRNGSGVITVVASGTPVKYEWYRNNINSARLTENPAQVKGTSTASLTLVNQQVTADYYVRVTDANGSAVVYGPFRFTVNLNCNIYARMGAEEVELRISLLGNPVQGDQLKATIQGAEGRALNVQLLDLSGRPVHQQQWVQADQSQTVEWSLGSQASGVYLLQAATPDQRQSVKVIKQ